MNRGIVTSLRLATRRSAHYCFHSVTLSGLSRRLDGTAVAPDAVGHLSSLVFLFTSTIWKLLSATLLQ